MSLHKYRVMTDHPMSIRNRKIKWIIAIATSAIVLIISTVTVLNLNRPEHLIGFQISVDDDIWGVVEDKEALDLLLHNYKIAYLENIDNNAYVKSVEFVERVEITEVNVFEEDYVSLDLIQEHLYTNIIDPTYYTVVRGDTMWQIAIDHGLSINRLVMYNPEIDPDRIWPGNKILVDPPTPRLSVIVSMENTLVESIPYFNEYIRDNTLLSTQKVVVKQGIDGKKAVTYDLKTLNGFPHQTNIIEEEELAEAVPGVIRVGTQTTLRRTSNTNFGVVSGRFTSGFGYRADPISGRRTFHNGIDIAAPAGTPVYAYANGRVVTAGWVGMGGNGVVIDHGNGLRTVYYHLSRIDVSVGQSVRVGQRIGGVGTTGYSTGNHLHFGVILHGKPVNPLNYI